MLAHERITAPPTSFQTVPHRNQQVAQAGEEASPESRGEPLSGGPGSVVACHSSRALLGDKRDSSDDDQRQRTPVPGRKPVRAPMPPDRVGQAALFSGDIDWTDLPA
jgi:hypothetical protein